MKAAAILFTSLLIGIGLAACSSRQLVATKPAAVPAALATRTKVNVITAPTNIFLSSTPSATSTPSVTLTPSLTPTGTPIPPVPSPQPPTLTPTALACLSQPGRIETGSLALEYLEYPLDFRIYLPPCYDQQPGRHYPVIYLIHGVGFRDDQWVRLGAPQACDALIADGEIAPFLVVMPRDRIWKRPSKDLFGQALIQDLIPWVDTHYRSLASREYRAIGGLSRGAAWAVHLGFSQWELFGAIGAHSLPVFLEDEPDIGNWIDQIPIGSFPRLFLDIADHDSPEVLESAFWFEEILIEKGIPHEWHLYPGEHKETYWQAHVEQYLRWYAAEW